MNRFSFENNYKSLLAEYDISFVAWCRVNDQLDNYDPDDPDDVSIYETLSKNYDAALRRYDHARFALADFIATNRVYFTFSWRLSDGQDQT